MPTKSDVELRRRHEAEASFHDRKYATGESFPRHYRVNPTYPVFVRMLESVGPDLSGKRVLEYGCGTGWITVELAKRGAYVHAFDISPEAVSQAKASVRDAGLSAQCVLQVMGGERLDYPDDTFDFAVGFAILHHLDLTATLSELHRVLKPGGKAFFAEPLGGNPLINLYRRLTPQYRTIDEAPINLDDLRRRACGFRRFEHHDQLLLAAAALALTYVPGFSRIARSAQSRLMPVDDALMRVLPVTRKWAWYSILGLEK
jgi:SAM-dependent methyltransferase